LIDSVLQRTGWVCNANTMYKINKRGKHFRVELAGMTETPAKNVRSEDEHYIGLHTHSFTHHPTQCNWRNAATNVADRFSMLLFWFWPLRQLRLLRTLRV